MLRWENVLIKRMLCVCGVLLGAFFCLFYLFALTSFANDVRANDVSAAESDLLALKSVAPITNPKDGSTITYTVTIFNRGPDAVGNIIAIDQLPLGITYVSDSSENLYDPVTGVLTVPGELEPGGQYDLSIVATVDVGASSMAPITNVVIISDSDSENDNPENNRAEVVINPRALESQMQVVKSVDNPTPTEGSLITYTVLVFNGGPDSVPNAVMVDNLPNGVTYVRDDGDGTYDPLSGIWHVPITLKPFTEQTKYTLTIVAAVDAETAGLTITNTATASAEGYFEIQPGNESDTAVIRPRPPIVGEGVTLEKTVDNETPVVGDVITYTIEVSAAENAMLVLTDTMPAGLTLLTPLAGDAISVIDGQTIVWQPQMNEEGAAVLTVTAQVNEGADKLGVLTNSVTVSGGGIATATVLPQARPLLPGALTITKAAVQTHTDLTYTVSITNIGGQAVLAEISDQMMGVQANNCRNMTTGQGAGGLDGAVQSFREQVQIAAGQVISYVCHVTVDPTITIVKNSVSNIIEVGSDAVYAIILTSDTDLTSTIRPTAIHITDTIAPDCEATYGSFLGIDQYTCTLPGVLTDTVDTITVTADYLFSNDVSAVIVDEEGNPLPESIVSATITTALTMTDTAVTTLTSVARTPMVVLSKTSQLVGDAITWTIFVTNDSDITSTIQITDTFPGALVAGCNGQAPTAMLTDMITLGPLATAVYTCASVISSTFAVTVSASADTILLDEPISYDVEIANTGDVPVEVEVIDVGTPYCDIASVVIPVTTTVFTCLSPQLLPTSDYTNTVRVIVKPIIKNTVSAAVIGVPDSERSVTDETTLPPYEVDDTAEGRLLEQKIRVEKTVGTTAGTCSQGNDVPIVVGTMATYCYRLINTGDITWDVHTIVDSVLGTIVTDLVLPVPPGASSPQLLMNTLVTTDVVNTVTWSAESLAYAVSITGTSIATVTAELLPEPSLHLEKTAEQIDDILTYRITLLNDGNVPVTAVLTDTMNGIQANFCTNVTTNTPAGGNSDPLTSFTEQITLDVGEMVNYVCEATVDPAMMITQSPSTQIVPVGDDVLLTVTLTSTSFLTSTLAPTIKIVNTKATDCNRTLTDFIGTMSYTCTVTDSRNDFLNTIDAVADYVFSNAVTATIIGVPDSTVTKVLPRTLELTDRDRAFVDFFVPPNPSLNVIKSYVVPDNGSILDLTLGDVVSYQILLINDGDVAITDVTITDTLPGIIGPDCGLSFPRTVLPGTLIFCTAHYTITTADIDAGVFVNQAIASGQYEGETIAAMGEQVIPPSFGASLTLQKGILANADEDGDGQPSIDDTLTWVFTATNEGNVPLSGVSIVDTLPGLSAMNCDTAAPVILAIGQSLICTATYTISIEDAAAGEISNFATAASRDPRLEAVDVVLTKIVKLDPTSATLTVQIGGRAAVINRLYALLIVATSVVYTKKSGINFSWGRSGSTE